MSDTGYYSLPTSKLHQKPETSRLKKFPVGYESSFYRNFLDLIFMEGSQRTLTYLLKMFKNIFWRHLILQRECKQILITM